jgi:hypothetical protein
MQRWTEIVLANSKDEFEELYSKLKVDYAEQEALIEYLDVNKYPLKHLFAKAWTDDTTHFGMTLKRFLNDSKNDLFGVIDACSDLHDVQYRNLKYSLVMQRDRVPTDVNAKYKTGSTQVSTARSHRRLFVSLSNNTSTLKMGARQAARAPLSGLCAFPVVTHSRALSISASRSNRNISTSSGGLNALQQKMVTGFHFYALLRRHQIQNGGSPPLLLLEAALVELATPQGVMLQAGRLP